MPIIKGLEQDSHQWHEYRFKHIMGTDTSIILESNPFKTKLELWEEKLELRAPQKNNPAMERGKLLESHARKLACQVTTCEFEPCVYQSNNQPWLAASLDGLSSQETMILEIKCMKESSHIDAIEGIIAPYYLDQIQTQLLCTGADFCFFFSYRPEYKDRPYAILEVFPDLEKHKLIIEKSYEFYVQLITMNPPIEWKLKEKSHGK